MPTWVDKILSSQSVQLGLAAVAFLIALLLVVIIARMLMGGRLRLPGGRARQARLGIVDAFDLDRQRQLIIVRRDNTEHLIMIGGPNDLVIESEIVRVEARDFRDARRDKGFDASTDTRIPARIGVPGDAQVAAESTQPRPDEPLLPLTLTPVPSQVDSPAPIAETRAPSVEAAGPRAPTFPLPPRRPSPVTPERRVPPPPLPDRVSRTDDPPFSPPAAPDVQPPMPSPSLQVPPAAPSVPGGLTAAPSTTSSDAGARPAPPRPSLLKPLPPRPPIRPLKRTTPQADPATSAPGAARKEPAAPVMPTPEAGPANPAPQTQPAPGPQLERPPEQTAAEAPPAAPPAPEVDAIESLEEEMAKLLGRG